MKGKLYRLDKQSGKMVEVTISELTFTLPALQKTDDSCPVCGGAPLSKEEAHQMLDFLDDRAESLDRRRCVEVQERIQDMREHL